MLAKSFAFSGPVKFERKSVKNRESASSVVVTVDPKMGVAVIKHKKESKATPKKATPIWSYAYTAEKQSLMFYSVELYKARSYLDSRRDSMEKRLEQQEQENKPKRNPKFYKVSGVDVRTDGRKVYFSTVGFGPGGAAMVIFTTIGNYDLVLTQVTDFEDDMDQEKRIKNPSMPTVELTEGFKRLERTIPYFLEKS